MGNRENIKNIQKGSKVFLFSNLKVFYSSEITEKDLKPHYLNHYIEAYLLSNFRLSSLKHELKETTDIEAKNVEVFVTTDRELYKGILKDHGMPWVTDSKLKQQFGFVSGGVNLCYIDHDVLMRYLPPRSFGLDSLCHEFTHILLPQYLDMGRDEYNRYWNNILDEGFAVLLNSQYEDIFNMKEDLKSNTEYDLNSISIKHLKENGFFKIDDRFVNKNFGYQYSASIVKKIDDVIRNKKEYYSDIPLRGLFGYIVNKRDRGESIESDLMIDFGIDINILEQELRGELGMS